MDENEEKHNIQIRKFLKQVGINSHRKIDQHLQDNNSAIKVCMKLEIDGKHIEQYKVEIKN